MLKKIDLERTNEDDFDQCMLPSELLRQEKNPAIVVGLHSDRERFVFGELAAQFRELEPGRSEHDARMLSTLWIPAEQLDELELEHLDAHCVHVAEAFALFGFEQTATIFLEIAAAFREEHESRRRVAELHRPKVKSARKRANGAHAPKTAEAHD